MSKKLTPREAREILGLTRKEVASASGLSIDTIRRIESGNNEFNIRYETAALLAEALACAVDDLKWPKPLTNIGRPPLTGRPCMTVVRTTKTSVSIITSVSVEYGALCDECHLTMPLTGECSCRD